MYLTGDRVRQRQDGVIEFLGRLDNQVKIAGHRVELDAIESAIADSPVVAHAAVMVLTPSSGEKELVACVSLSRPADDAEAQLRFWLSERLSRASIPQHWLFLERLPDQPQRQARSKSLEVAMREIPFILAGHQFPARTAAIGQGSSRIIHSSAGYGVPAAARGRVYCIANPSEQKRISSISGAAHCC